jgi:hypothetical protein
MGTRKRIGIKYCGGCNPTYERVEIVDKIQFRFGDKFLFHRYSEQEGEALILVSGCHRTCAGQGLHQEQNSCYSLTGEGDFETLIEWLTTLEEKGDFK